MEIYLDSLKEGNQGIEIGRRIHTGCVMSTEVYTITYYICSVAYYTAKMRMLLYSCFSQSINTFFPIKSKNWPLYLLYLLCRQKIQQKSACNFTVYSCG